MTVDSGEPRDPMYIRPQRQRSVLLVVPIVVGLVILLWLGILLSRSQVVQEDVLVCNGTDCTWFPSWVIDEGTIPQNCRWVKNSALPTHWQCGLVTR